MTFENFIWNGLNKDIIVVDVTFDEIKLCFPCSGYFKCISDTLPSNHNTCTELNKTHLIPKKRRILFLFSRGSLSVIVVNNTFSNTF